MKSLCHNICKGGLGESIMPEEPEKIYLNHMKNIGANLEPATDKTNYLSNQTKQIVQPPGSEYWFG